MNRTCETCAYFESGDSVRDGLCHRYPPRFKVFTDGDEDVESFASFVPVYKTEWCGEWSKKEETDDDQD